MRTFIVSGLCATVSLAALFERQVSLPSSASLACNPTAWETISSGIHTHAWPMDSYRLLATTTTVTVYSWGASPLASSNPESSTDDDFNLRRDLPPRNEPTPPVPPTQPTPPSPPVPPTVSEPVPPPQPTPPSPPVPPTVTEPVPPPQPTPPTPPTPPEVSDRKKRHAAIPGAYKQKRDLELCATPSITITTTVPSMFTTITATHVLPRQARATVTAAACDAANNYGLFNGTLSNNLYYSNGNVPTVQHFPNLTVAECCKQCFQDTEGCVAWSYGGSVNNTSPVEGCAVASYDGGCPTTWGMDTIGYPNEEKYPVGVGACNVQVDWFQAR